MQIFYFIINFYLFFTFIILVTNLITQPEKIQIVWFPLLFFYLKKTKVIHK